MKGTIFTIGHGRLGLAEFLRLIRQNGIQMIVDVRSSPYSRQASWANRGWLESEFTSSPAYRFMGGVLGGRPQNPELYENGQVSYERMAESQTFQQHLSILETHAGRIRMCLMCSEEDPIRCHRFLLVARALEKAGVKTLHIRHSGEVESFDDAISRMMREYGRRQAGLFLDEEQLIAEAFQAQSALVAYRQTA